MGNTNNINIEFKEDEYRDIVYAMDGYTHRLRKLYIAKEKLKRDRITWIVTLSIILLLAAFSVYELTKINVIPVKELLTVATITTFILFAIPTVIFLYRHSRNNLYDPLNDTRAIIYTRKQLIKFVSYISQVLDHNEFSPPKKFLMDLKLSEAEDIIHLTAKIAKKYPLPYENPFERNNPFVKTGVTTKKNYDFEPLVDKPAAESPTPDS